MASLAAKSSRVDPGSQGGQGRVHRSGMRHRSRRRNRPRVNCSVRSVCWARSELAEFNKIGPYVVIGGEPQDLSYRGGCDRVEIGDFNTIGERVTVHRGSEKEDGITRLGSHNTFCSGSHVAHDWQARRSDNNRLIIHGRCIAYTSNQTCILIAKKVGIHQFSTIGCNSYIGGQTKITQDVPCYMRVAGSPSSVRGINGRSSLTTMVSPGRLRAALRSRSSQLIFLARMTLGQATEILDEHDQLSPEVIRLLEFLESQHKGRLGRARGAASAGFDRGSTTKSAF